MSLKEILDTQDSAPAHDEKTVARLRFADAAEALLRNIFAALGARNAHALDVADVLSGLGAWLALLMTMLRFREGDAAVIWLDARRVAWERGQSLSPDAARREANEQADAAVHDFYQRFPPSLDTRDQEIEALQEEAHGLRAIADAAKERAEQAVRDLNAAIADVQRYAERSERTEREFAAYKSAVYAATGLPLDGGGYDVLTILRDNARDARGLDDERERAGRAERELAEARAAIGAVSGVAIVPQPKPERVEPGQRWAFVMTAGPIDMMAPVRAWTIGDGIGSYKVYLPIELDFGPPGDASRYLGPAPTVEG